VADPEDILEIGGRCLNGGGRAPRRSAPVPTKRFLMVWYRCCNAYGRMYRNREETMYEGRCPKCGARVHALIGPDGTNQRCFEAT